MTHNFWNCLDYEASKANMANNFYYNQLGIESLIRFDTGSEADMKFQRADIDVQLHGWGRFANVSEKFRKKDYNDLYLELYSMYPETKGWMERNEADYLAYFFPTRVLWINKSHLHEFFHNEVSPQIDANWLTEIQLKFPKKNGQIKHKLNHESISIIKAHNRTKTKTWDTLGVTVSLNWVKEHLKIKEYAI